MAAVLVTLAQAKAHLHITATTDDEDIQFKLDQAEAIIRNYLKTQDDPAWTAATVPPPIKSAILLMLARLYEQRGDNEQNDEALWAAVDRMLARYRDPAIA